MRKFLPVIVSFMAFTGFLAVQVAFNIVNTSVEKSDKDKVKKDHYENIFKEQVFVDTKNERITLAEVASPVIIINFWASWCAPCLVELPSLVDISQKYGSEKILILGVNTDETRQLEKIKKITARYEINFPIVPDSKGEILDDFVVLKIPTTLIFYKGKLVKHMEGAENFISENMVKFLDELLEE